MESELRNEPCWASNSALLIEKRTATASAIVKKFFFDIVGK